MIRALANALGDRNLAAVQAALEGDKNTTIVLNDSAAAACLSSCVSTPFVYVVPSLEGAAQAAKILSQCGLKTAAVSTAPEMPIYTDASASRDTELSSALNKFTSGTIDALVLPSSAILACVPQSRTENFVLNTNEKLSVKYLTEKLAEFGYNRIQTISQSGEFSVRGDVVDFWQEGAANPHRIMFLGDTVEAIKTISIETFLSIEKLHTCELSPISELTNISNNLIIGKLSAINPTTENTADIIERLLARARAGENLGGIRWLLPFLAEFCPAISVVAKIAKAFIFDKPREIVESIKNTDQQNNLRYASLLEGGLLLPEHKKMFCAPSELMRALQSNNNKAVCFGFQGINSSHDLFKSAQVLSLKTAPVANYFSNLSALVPDIVRAVDSFKKTALVFVGNAKACENYMSAKHIPFVYSTPATVKIGKINIIARELSASFELSDSNAVIYSTLPVAAETRETNVFESARTKFTMPAVGEIVVHEHHGLGRFLGIKKLVLQDAERDYIVLQYDGGSLVYLPPEQTAILSNYSGEPTRLSKIGGQDFANAKQRVRRRLKELSFKLSELYSKRARVKANNYDCDETSIMQFAIAFPYALTPDQQKVVAAVESDMKSNKIMDRLICGDVGFGKTEVAFRAAFRAISSGFQVAMLAPTTILSIQHYNTARARFEPFGVRVEVLNRFKSDIEVTKILRDLRRGEVDLVIGTHRLLGTDIKYKNLGLLILDEEQRFGVGHKEKIKQLKTNIDILTLSATPIPRTLNMALIGIRDISVITTPPVNRFPVITYVSEFSMALMLDAIEREMARGGQTIVLFNDVSKIDAFAARIQKEVRGRVGIIHGQMNETRLENTIIDLYDRKIDILVASTIIENGIDISTANTLIAIDADRLGVAQMHQLRGRVGRANQQAYAYFMYAYNKEISQIAKSRLDAIQSYYGSGAGIQIAMKDLSLRGAGNILGANQSGHMEQIGFDTYCKILEEVANENRGVSEASGDNEQEIEPVLDFSLNCFIPHSYVESETERMKIYTAISQIKIRDDMNKTLAHLEDLYGRIPQEVRNIVIVGYIRALAKHLSIKLIAHKKDDTRIVFDNRIEREPIRLKTATVAQLIQHLEKLASVG